MVRSALGRYRQLMVVHHQTVDSFVDELLDGVTESTAAETALAEVVLAGGRRLQAPGAVGANGGGGGGGGGGAGADDDEVIRDLVASMVLPGVEREMVRLQAAAEGRQYVDAAAAAVNRVVGGAQQ